MCIRDSLMPDIDMFGLTYMQQISETSSGAGLHIEPGIWVNVPRTTNPSEPPTVVRMASIPHGTAILHQTIKSRTFIQIYTKHTPIRGGGTANTAFLADAANPPGGNANAVEVDATFWIETVAGLGGQP